MGELCNVCETTHADPRAYDFSHAPQKCTAKKVEKRGSQFWFYGYGAEESDFCIIRIPGRYGRRFGAYDHRASTRRVREENFHDFLPYWYLYPPAMKVGR
jgi:hypothetical protein